MAEAKVGETFACTCKQTLRVPRESGGRCRVKTPVDWLVELLIYGGGGGLLGLGLGLVIASRIWWWGRGGAWSIVVVTTLVGLLLGTFGGERGVNWVGSMIRDHEG